MNIVERLELAMLEAEEADLQRQYRLMSPTQRHQRRKLLMQMDGLRPRLLELRLNLWADECRLGRARG